MTELVTEHLPLVAGAPEGMKRLRQLIVDLAVSNRLIGASSAVAWQQTELSEIVASFQNGVSSRGTADGIAVTVLRLADIKAGKVCLEDLRELVLDAESIAKYLLLEGDVLVIRVNGSADLVGRFVVYAETIRALHCDHFIRLRFDRSRVEPRFLKLIGDASTTRDSIQRLFVSTAGQKTVNQGHIGSLAVQLPPVKEQHRIVAKVDELMALCDRLEADQADAEAAHAQLVQALLDSLTQATDAADFRAHWQRLSEHFHTLFTTEASIDALKQTVLQLAVMGKLVPQLTTEEPAECLLATIRQGVRGKKFASIESPDFPGEIAESMVLPHGWSWARFGDICSIASDLVQPQAFMDSEQLAPDCIEKGSGRIILRRTVRESGIKGPNSRFVSGQIVYSKIRPSLSKAVLVDFDGLCSADMYPINSHILSRYQLRLMLSELFLAQVRVAENRVKMPKLNQESLNAFVVPIPPLAEQHRIVAKVDELMALCDQLKAQLADARQQHAQLATALIEQAVA